MTEKIEIFPDGSNELDFSRIYQFSNVYDFKSQLEKVAHFLREEYDHADLSAEYQEILQKHSSKARALKVIHEAKTQFAANGENATLVYQRSGREVPALRNQARTPKVKRLAPKRGMCAGPGLKSTNQIVNLLGWISPVDTPHRRADFRG